MELVEHGKWFNAYPEIINQLIALLPSNILASYQNYLQNLGISLPKSDLKNVVATSVSIISLVLRVINSFDSDQDTLTTLKSIFDVIQQILGSHASLIDQTLPLITGNIVPQVQQFLTNLGIFWP